MSNESVIVANTASYSDKDGENSQVDIIPVDSTAIDEGQLDCTCICCSNEMEAYQPKQRDILEQFSRKGRHYVLSWYEKHVWKALCASKKKIYCRYALKHNMFTPCGVKPDAAFTTRGFEILKRLLKGFLLMKFQHPITRKDEMRIKIQANFSATIACGIS